MKTHLESKEVALHRFNNGSIGIDYRPNFGGGYQVITYCPWCGTNLIKECIKKAVDEGKVEMSSTDEVDSLQPYVDRILLACAKGLGRDPNRFLATCWVSDLSAVSDFAPFEKEEKEAFYEAVSKELGIVVRAGESMILDIARRLMD